MTKQKIDWTRFITEQSRVSAVLKTDDLARKFGVSERIVSDALKRQARKGLVKHFGKKLFINSLAHDFSGREVVNILRSQSYISLETALREWGISSQTPVRITSVTTGDPGTFGRGTVQITFRHISAALFWGFLTRRTRYGHYDIAEPEKALLDWVYLSRKRGVILSTEEFDVSKINGEKLLKYSEKFPRPVREDALSLLVSRLAVK